MGNSQRINKEVKFDKKKSKAIPSKADNASILAGVEAAHLCYVVASASGNCVT